MQVFRSILYWSSVLFFLSACQNNQHPILSSPTTPVPLPLPAPAEHTVSFQQEIRPIIETKCMACHSCYDAPCQLKLETTEGLLRGANHDSIYGGPRTEAMRPCPVEWWKLSDPS